LRQKEEGGRRSKMIERNVNRRRSVEREAVLLNLLILCTMQLYLYKAYAEAEAFSTSAK